MHGFYWSVERCGWERCPSAPDALVTPWSAHGLPAPALASAASAGEVLRLAPRQALAPTAVPPPREPGPRPAALRR
jgi:hypothetical protein